MNRPHEKILSKDHHPVHSKEFFVTNYYTSYLPKRCCTKVFVNVCELLKIKIIQSSGHFGQISNSQGDSTMHIHFSKGRLYCGVHSRYYVRL